MKSESRDGDCGVPGTACRSDACISAPTTIAANTIGPRNETGATKTAVATDGSCAAVATVTAGTANDARRKCSRSRDSVTTVTACSAVGTRTTIAAVSEEKSTGAAVATVASCRTGAAIDTIRSGDRTIRTARSIGAGNSETAVATVSKEPRVATCAAVVAIAAVAEKRATASTSTRHERAARCCVEAKSGTKQITGVGMLCGAVLDEVVRRAFGELVFDSTNDDRNIEIVVEKKLSIERKPRLHFSETRNRIGTRSWCRFGVWF